MNLLFVCSGNICRSPMAERMAEDIGDRVGVRVQAKSAGTLGIVDAPAATQAIRACRSIGIDLTDHRSQGLSDDLLAWADHVLVMEFAHASHIREFFPAHAHKVLPFGTFAGVSEIEDPVGRWWWVFRRVRTQLDKGLHAFFARTA